MAGKPKKILFISHEAGLSGATFVLLELMKWMKVHEQVEVTILLKEDGPIKDRFDEIGKTYLYDYPQSKRFNRRALSAVYNRVIWPRQKQQYRNRLLNTLRQGRFDLIYANTISVGEIIDFLNPLQCRVVTHVHELQYVIDCMGAENMQQVINATSFYVAVCEEIKSLLIQNYNIDNAKILVIPEFVNFAKIDSEKSGPDIRQQLNLPAESFIVGGAGSIEWRKGVDIFVEVAIRVLAEMPAAHFIWVGNPRETNIMAKLNYDIKKAGLEKNIHFIGPYKNPYPYYGAFNLFLLTSREDPYPLVCIENMYLNNPVICFEKSGGAVALVSGYQFGKPVSYLNTAQMAETVINNIKSKGNFFPPVDIERLKKEHSVETIAPKVFQAISNLQ
jgi:glycosyltransferase involved in cell wall biosynthesis